MQKIKKVTAGVLAVCMLFAAGCTPQKVETAKDSLAKVTFYCSLARSLINVASLNYADNPKVQKALSATSASLKTLESLVAIIGAGLSKDMDKINPALTRLVQDVFNLMVAIDEAKKIK